MPARLTIAAIQGARSDAELLKMISAALARAMREYVGRDVAATVRGIRKLPKGLRAMAATYELDVSMTLDDLGWHFLNWHDRDLCEETHQGLVELEAHDFARWFQEARDIVAPFWDEAGRVKLSEEASEWNDWLEATGLEAKLAPLNDKFWEWFGAEPRRGILEQWIAYARKYPERLVPESGS